MLKRFVCLGFSIYFMKKYIIPEKLNKLSNRAARLVRNSLPQYSECQHFLVQQNWEAIHEVLS